MNVFLGGVPALQEKEGTLLEILDILTLAIELINFVTSDEAVNLFILPVRFVGKSDKKEKN